MPVRGLPRLVAVFASLLCLTAPLPAQTPATATTPPAGTTIPTLRAERRDGPILLDAKLDEPAWQKAPAGTEFTQSYPKARQTPTQRTEVRVLYDDDALYVGVKMFDAHPDSIAAQLARRDASGIYSDWVHVIIDSYYDRRTAFRFTVNPMGVKKDVYVSNDGPEDINWDAVWEVETRVDADGWTAEYRIPFSQLRFGTARGERVWGFQVMRDIARNNERASFAPWVPQEAGFVSRFGNLTGLVDIPSPRRLEVMPYVSSRLTSAPGDAANPFYKSKSFHGSVGGDVRWGMPGGLTLTATVNPDFGQVEVDPAVVNLSAFETFFPEKRPFFLEGSDVFSFGNVIRNNDYGGQTFLYSRRIGRTPQRFPGGSGVAYFDAPEQTTIAGAAKITGKRGPWTIGVMDAVTPEERADLALTDGTRAETPVEPLSNYFAGRLRRDFRAGNTVIGAMATHTVRKLEGATFDDILPGNAAFAGLDFEHRWGNRQWALSGFTSMSRVAGSPTVIGNVQRSSIRYYQRPDADYLEVDPDATSLSGHLSSVALSKRGSTDFSLSLRDASPGFEINDFGFHGRMDYRSVSTFVGRQNFTPSKRFRSSQKYLYTNHTWNYGGTSIFQSVGMGLDGTFANFWNGGIGGGVNPDYYNDRLTRGGPIALNPKGWNVNAYLSSDSRKPVVLNGGVNGSRNDAGGWSRSFELGVNARPTSSVSVRFGPEISSTHSISQYVRGVNDAGATNTFGRRHVFAELDQTTLSLDTRVEWTLTPTLSLQTYMQPFVAVGRYSNFKEFAKPKTLDFLVYGEDVGTISRSSDGVFTVDPDGSDPSPSFTFADPTFNIRSLRGNAVLRWEYRPGSALFFVWQQQRSDFEPIGDFELGRDVGAIFRTHPTNIFLLKATYWFNR